VFHSVCAKYLRPVARSTPVNAVLDWMDFAADEDDEEDFLEGPAE
jgi:hypothetical protein